MRYPRHSIQVSDARDVPILRQILHSQFITQSQLFEFMTLHANERNRESFDWRVRRLAKHKLVRRTLDVAGRGEFVLSLEKSAAALLQSVGEYCLVGDGRSTRRCEEGNTLHALGLNEIHLSILRSGALIRWASAVEIRSQNELTSFGYAKDYDAVMTVGTDGGEYKFGLEYERSPKTTKSYRAIAEALSEEVHVSQVLYLAPNYDLLRFVSRFFSQTKCRVLFGLVRDWHSQLLDMRISEASTHRSSPLREALCRVGEKVETRPKAAQLPLL